MKRWLKIVFFTTVVTVLFSLLALGALAAGLTAASFKTFGNHWDNGDLVAANNSVIFDRFGHEVTQLHGPENRIDVPFDKIPLHLRNAFLVMEDVRFYDHPGLDVQGIIRAMVVDLREEQMAQGASTITQQLARNAFLSNEKTWQRKLKELVMARELEKRYSKDEIFSLYLNRIYFGHGVYGVQAASRRYFGKDISGLNLAECALLAGIPRNPNLYAPVDQVDEAKARRSVVIRQMVDYGMITGPQATEAEEQDIKVIKPAAEKTPYPYYIDQVIKEAEDKFGISERDLYQGGYRIYTGLDPVLQSKGEALAADRGNFPGGEGSELVQCGMAAVDYTKGEIRAL
ncbi:MAG TPA: transglycosylase domain-containing protein, partial [Bacillota bacterium]|nr:transglycosylase domain-containing protein [Bacillota bacterium]